VKEKSCVHKRLISNKLRVIDKVYHIQTVNGAIANFKGWVNGKMKGVTTKYLSNYLAWYRESNAKLDKQQILVVLMGDNNIMEQSLIIGEFHPFLDS
jgi:exonuclease III